MESTAAMDPIDRVDQTGVGLLAGLAPSDPDTRHWTPEEQASVWAHQMSAPLAVDLGALAADGAARLETRAAVQGVLLRSFHDLLLHPRPPLELLELVKNFAKLNRRHPRSPLPPEVSAGLYYACIAAALVSSGKRLTTVGDEDLRKGLAWLRSQSWVDEQVRTLAEAAHRLVSGTPPGDVRDL